MEKRKFISFFLCISLLMAMTLSPAAAFAAEAEPAQASEAAQTEPAHQTESAQESTVQIQTQAPAAESTSVSEPSEPSGIQAADPSEAATEPSSEEQAETPQQTQETSTAQPAQTKDADEEQQEAVDTQAGDAEEMDAAKESTANPQPKASAPAQKKSVTAEKTVNGIKVSGGVEGKDWVYDSKEQTLTISKDGMTVSGTATDNLIILCTLAASTLTLDNLDHGKHEVQIVSGQNEEDKTDLTLILKGTNKVSAVVGSGDVTVIGKKNSRLDLTAGMTAFNDLNFRNATVTGGIFAADRDINITGTSRVTARPTKELAPALEMGLPVAMMTAGRDINIDLAPGGSVTASGMKTAEADVLPMLAMGHINISKNSRLVLPKNGKVTTSDLFDILPVQIITDGSGKPASDVQIEYGAGQNSAAAFVTASYGQGMANAYPQTGDDSASMLLVLYLILAAAGSLSIALRIHRNRVGNEII